MRKLIFYGIALTIFPILISAKTIIVKYRPDDNIAGVEFKDNRAAGAVEFYENGKLLGKFNNLIINEPAVSSSLSPLAGGGIALVTDSNGSRNKYHTITPIIKMGGKLYVDCNYKTFYDSVDEMRAVGTSCKKIELSNFDASTAINEKGMISYSDKPEWLKTISSSVCNNSVGFEYGSFRVARCGASGVSDSKDQTIVVFDGSGNLLFSVTGYELIPRLDHSQFFLVADLQNKTIVFNGNLICFPRTNPAQNALSGTATIADRLAISYTYSTTQGCLSGQYAYVGRNKNITIKGYKDSRLFYLMEMDKHNISTGLFMLDHFNGSARGVWVGVPPREPLIVN